MRIGSVQVALGSPGKTLPSSDEEGLTGSKAPAGVVGGFASSATVEPPLQRLIAAAPLLIQEGESFRSFPNIRRREVDRLSINPYTQTRSS